MTNPNESLVERLPELDKLYKMHLTAASYDNWKQHCEVWRKEAHEAADELSRQAERIAVLERALRKLRAIMPDESIWQGPYWNEADAILRAALRERLVAEGQIGRAHV